MKAIGWIIAGLLAALLIFRECSHNPTPELIVRPKPEHIEFSDTGRHIFVIDSPVPVYRDTGSWNVVEAPVDSAAIYRMFLDYMMTYYYDDTLKNDTSAFVQLKQRVQGNRLQRLDFIFENRRPTAIFNNYDIVQENPTWQICVGVRAMTGNAPALGPELAYIRKKTGYFAGYDFLGKNITFGVNYQIFKH